MPVAVRDRPVARADPDVGLVGGAGVVERQARRRRKPGRAAAVTSFDPATSASVGRPERCYDLPGGAKRMVMRSRGIEYTLVNGEVTWEKGALTGAAAGRVLRS